jgi:hypothetical protein
MDGVATIAGATTSFEALDDLPEASWLNKLRRTIYEAGHDAEGVRIHPGSHFFKINVTFAIKNDIHQRRYSR